MSKYYIGDVVQVLDQGYIKLVDVMGSDKDICTAARVSYHEGSTKKVNEDKGLIDHLLRHRHTSPFEMGEMKFEIKLPIFVERQWVRHRTCSMNEMSGRYSEMPEEYHMPDHFRMQDTVDKQSTVGSVGCDASVGKFVKAREDNARRTWQNYHDEMAAGVGREQAREMLPLATYTKKVWKMDLHNLFHFLKLRTDSHAQWEIQLYAKEIEQFVRQHFPWSYASWKNHIKDAVTFSADEWAIIDSCINYQSGPRCGDPSMLDEVGEEISKSKLSKARKAELKKKLGLNNE